MTDPVASDHRRVDYRPDIDGLRAIAVGAVLLFHADVPGFAGGFVGVDVFFVISGFLITRIVLTELDRQTFSLKEFYARRVRRIFPALFAMLLICLAAGAMILLPTDLHGVGISAVAHYEDGSSTRADFDQWIGAMADSRYRMMIGNAFGTLQELARCDEFLEASAKAGNGLLEDGQRITGFELQLWEWSFSTDPDSASRGQVVDFYTYPVTSPR